VAGKGLTGTQVNDAGEAGYNVTAKYVAHRNQKGKLL
jgi:hypothetical protein